MLLALLRFRLAFVFVAMALGLPALLPAQEKAAGPSRWEAAIREFEEQDASEPPTPGGVVFVGSSSIRLWDLKGSFPELDAVNRGFGGSQLSDVAHYARRIVTPHKPRLVVVYAGDNDIAAGKTPEQVVQAYRQLVKTVHAESPQTRIAFIAIKPSLRRWEMVERMREANRAIAQIAAKDARLEFIDIDAPMLGPDGRPRAELFRPDGLHLSAAGYKIWAERLRPVLAERDFKAP